LNIERRKIAELKNDPANARKHSPRNLKAIRDSLDVFGQQKPIVVDSRGVVIAGNGTLEAARELGWDEIDVAVTDLDPAHAQAFGIADNRTAELAEWDTDVLGQLLEGMDSNLADILSIDDLELPDSIDGGGQGEGLTDPDEVPEPPIEPITQTGDLWLLGEHRLLCGDSTKAEDVARLMDGAKIDLCFTSPPYNSKDGGYKTDYHGKTKKFYNHKCDNRTEDEWVVFCDSVLCLVASHLKSDSSPVVWNVMYTANCRSGYGRTMFAGSHLLTVKETICWDKGAGFPTASCGILSRNWELVFVLSKGDDYITTQGKNEPRWAKWNIQRPKQHDDHKATFPIELACRAITDFGHEGTNVYDPFLGSGTTLMAAEQLGRKCYGMEISPQYCDVIVKRWEDFTGKTATRENERT